MKYNQAYNNNKKIKCTKYQNFPKKTTKQTQREVYSEGDLQIKLLETCKVVSRHYLIWKDTQNPDGKDLYLWHNDVHLTTKLP